MKKLFLWNYYKKVSHLPTEPHGYTKYILRVFDSLVGIAFAATFFLWNANFSISFILWMIFFSSCAFFLLSIIHLFYYTNRNLPYWIRNEIYNESLKDLFNVECNITRKVLLSEKNHIDFQNENFGGVKGGYMIYLYKSINKKKMSQK